MQLEQIIDYALAGGGSESRVTAADSMRTPDARPRLARSSHEVVHEPRSGPHTYGLTAREAEVLRCVAAGHTNREIATNLFISPKTVGHHLASIFAKLGVASRAAANALAVRHDMA